MITDGDHGPTVPLAEISKQRAQHEPVWKFDWQQRRGQNQGVPPLIQQWQHIVFDALLIRHHHGDGGQIKSPPRVV
jgi:hypothetical protein